jgi:hypothetical protein
MEYAKRLTVQKFYRLGDRFPPLKTQLCEDYYNL